MNNASRDIADKLVNLTSSSSVLKLTLGSNLFVGRQPTNPENCVTIVDRPSWPMNINLDGSCDFDYASIQVNVRNLSYNAAATMAQAIIELLHGANNFKINATDYFVCMCVSGPSLLEWDQNNRAILICDFDIQRRR